MLISIGILAHNEEEDIGFLIEDLGKQDILKLDHSYEIHVVANGCTDQTASVSKLAFSQKPFQAGNIKTLVHTIPQAGKSNAWNVLIHDFSSSATEVMFLLDADIRIPETTSLNAILKALVETKEAVIAVDRSVKDLSLRRKKSFTEWIILAASGTAHDTRKSIAGGLYCARFPVLRSIWMPIGLPGEDGFLRAMILTDKFSSEEDERRLVRVETARHVFESEKRISDVFRHNIRLAIGTAINVLIFKHFRQQLAANKRIDIADYIMKRNVADPNWVNELIRNKVLNGGYFVIEKKFALRRLQWFSSLSFAKRIQKAPIFILGLTFDFLLVLRANQLMRNGAGAGYW